VARARAVPEPRVKGREEQAVGADEAGWVDEAASAGAVYLASEAAKAEPLELAAAFRVVSTTARACLT
jgi:hypothetical protein